MIYYLVIPSNTPTLVINTRPLQTYNHCRPQNDLDIPSCVSEVFQAPIIDVCHINRDSKSEKKTYLWTLDIQVFIIYNSYM